MANDNDRDHFHGMHGSGPVAGCAACARRTNRALRSQVRKARFESEQTQNASRAVKQ